MPHQVVGSRSGSFLLLPDQQLLLDSGKPVRLGARALAILTVLVEHAGDLVSKDDLIKSVWPNTFVQESNPKVHVATLRQILRDGRDGNRYVVNVSSRGYRFVAAVSLTEALPIASSHSAVARLHNLPAALTRVVGRADVIAATAALISQRRFVTVVGPGGIGKITVALAVADTAKSYKDGRIFADLAPLGDPLLLPSSLASLLGVAVHSETSIPYLLDFLADKQVLMVLDSCEHLLEAAAGLVEELLKGARGLHILATSREPLRAAREVVRRLPPLEIPPLSDTLTGAEALAFSAVQLFVERAGSSSDTFELSDVEAQDVFTICRRLDGNALAIELAAGRVDAFGISGVAARLVDRFQPAEGWQTGSLAAAPSARCDSQLELRSPIGRRTDGSASFVGLRGDLHARSSGCGRRRPDHQRSGRNRLRGGSSREIPRIGRGDQGSTRYRLLDMTSAYARKKLIESGELGASSERHAEYYRELFEQAAIDYAARNATDWIFAFADQADNVRAALDWCYSESGANKSIGVALTIATVPLWLNLSLMEECRQRVQKALFRLGALKKRALVPEMQLHTALGVALYSIGPSPEFDGRLEALFGDRQRTQEYRLLVAGALGHVDCVRDRRRATGGIVFSKGVLRLGCGSGRSAIIPATNMQMLRQRSRWKSGLMRRSAAVGSSTKSRNLRLVQMPD